MKILKDVEIHTGTTFTQTVFAAHLYVNDYHRRLITDEYLTIIHPFSKSEVEVANWLNHYPKKKI